MLIKLEIQSTTDKEVILKINSTELDRLEEIYFEILTTLYYHNPEAFIAAIDKINSED